MRHSHFRGQSVSTALSTVLTLSLGFSMSAFVAAPSALAAPGLNMIGGQSQNEGISAVPAPGAVKVDGDLSDWDFSGRIQVFPDEGLRSKYGVEVGAMWDAQNLYLAAKWRDPTPMMSAIDPRYNPQFGWKSDAIQLRVQTDQKQAITTWYYTADKRSVMQLGVWKDPNNEHVGYNNTLLQSPPRESELGQGIAMAYRIGDDGAGYIQEIRLPWKVLYKNPPAPQAGQVLQMGMEFLWGDASGTTTQTRYADNMQPGQTSREFFWTNTRAWGDVSLLDHGHLEMRQYHAGTNRLTGAVPLRFEIPEAAAQCTVVIEDETGKRVRNLAGAVDVADYSVGIANGRRTVEIPWDGRDDAGQLVTAGRYHVRGLTQNGLDVRFDSSYYSPATPPWLTADGKGGWGGDHSNPGSVVASGDTVICGWPVAEGGSGIIGLDTNGHKKWAEKSGAIALSADSQYLYVIARGFGLKNDPPLVRLNAADGSYRPFQLDGKDRPFALSVKDILGDASPAGAGTALATANGQLALSLDDGRLLILDAATAKPLRVFKPGNASTLTWGASGLYGVFDGQLKRVDVKSGIATPLHWPGLMAPLALTSDSKGNVAVFDNGPDSQIKLFSPDGKLLGTMGQKGGRPLRGAFVPQSIAHATGLAFDKAGHCWAAENQLYPRRISVWNSEGQLVRDYVGNTAYSASGSFLSPDDPTLGYVNAVEMKVEATTGSYAVKSILWQPDPVQNEAFPLYILSGVGNWFPNPVFVDSAAAGASRRYLTFHAGRMQHALYMQRGDHWQPVAAITSVDDLKRQLPALTLGEHADNEIAFWNDEDENGRVSADELSFAPTTGRHPPTGGLWGTHFDENLWLFADNGLLFKPLRFTTQGAPVYGPASLEKSPVTMTGDYLSLPAEHRLLALDAAAKLPPGTGLGAYDTRTGTPLWTYPNPYGGVHGSHEAPMPAPGLLIGPLKFAGTAPLEQGAGTIFLIRGNLGQDYLFTSDGLFVGSLFKDVRLPGAIMPPTYVAARGQSVRELSESSEPFSGWFGRQSDGKVRLITNLGAQSVVVVDVEGLESVARFTAPDVTLTPALLQQATQSAAPTQKNAPKIATVAALAQAPLIDGRTDDWPTENAATISTAGMPVSATVKLGYDARNLYCLYEVQDSTPMQNEGKDPTRLFKTGDALDLQIGPAGARKSPGPRDSRVVFSMQDGQPIAVLMRPTDPSAPAALNHTYTSPIMEKKFDRVEVLAEVQVALTRSDKGYILEAAIPWSALKIVPQAGAKLRGDVGVIASDATGRIDAARLYWANPHTNLVSDLPSEAWFDPSAWGTWQLK